LGWCSNYNDHRVVFPENFIGGPVLAGKIGRVSGIFRERPISPYTGYLVIYIGVHKKGT
jgi:hypothetical protein